MTRGQHRDAFVVEAASGSRFELAFERFLKGLPFEFRQVSFAMASDGAVVVGVDTSWSASDVTIGTAAADFELAQSALRELVATSSSFATAVRGRAIRYELLADYGTGSVLLCTLEDGGMTWSPGMPERVGDRSSSNPATALPAEVRVATVRWLEEMDDGLVALAKTARGLDFPAGPALAQAVSEVAERIAHFRLVLVGAVPLSKLLPSHTNPLGTVDKDIAEATHHEVRRVATLPPEVTNAAHSHLPEDSIRRAFLRQVGDVAGTAFVNLARSLWEDHPHLAPPRDTT